MSKDSPTHVPFYESELARFADLRAARGPTVPDGAATAGPQLARLLHDLNTVTQPTWAWPLPGGEERGPWAVPYTVRSSPPTTSQMSISPCPGGDWPGPPDASTPSPSTMTIDYVRFYGDGHT